MKVKIFSLLTMFVMTASIAMSQQNPYQGLQQYKLDNGLTVYLWEDHDKPNVYGRVICRAGAFDEPAEYTGLAHYLEHMLFKGTQTIGALDWEKEKPIYEEIIHLYDKLATITDEKERAALQTKINEKSMEAAKYTATDDFSNMTEAIGGEGLNAFTSYDLTAYHSEFPTFQMEKWLELNSERFINPVFRSFQAELENVFEEYNMYQDEYSTHQSDFINSKIFAGTPYERNVIGYPEHLKNPHLSKLIEFYNTWYVPNNMALLLVGNFNAEEVKPLIAAKFGRLQAKPIPARKVNQYPQTNYSGNKKYTMKVGYYPQINWIYAGVPMGHKDALAIDFCLALLNNSHNTGMLDRLMLDGELTAAYAANDERLDRGNIRIIGIPYYDVAQRSFESDKQTEKIIMAEIDKLKNGNFSDELFNSVKAQQLQSYDLMFETPDTKVSIITYTYAYNLPLDYFLKMNEAIKALTKADVQAIAKKYLSGDHITISFTEGDPKKNKLKKPAIKPLDPPKGVETAYEKTFKTLPVGKVEESYNNFADVTEIKLYDGVKLFCNENKKNNVFSLTLKYGIGTEKMPKLEYAADLMNTAGMMPDVKAQDLRNQFSKLGATCSYGVDNSYFYITVSGDEQNLEEICKLMTRQTLMPKLDNKQIESTIGSEINSRMREKRNPDVLASALMEYVLYGDKSKYIDRIPVDELYKPVMVGDVMNVNYLLSNTELTTTIGQAISYAVDIYFVGKTPATKVAEILKANTPLQQNVTPSTSPEIRTRKNYDKNTIFFLPNRDIQQAKVYFYVDGLPYNITEDVDYDAFNQYFSGGFSGLVMNEIREKRSMAYTAYGYMSRPRVAGKDSYLIGYVGTQSDKVADALDVYMDLLKNMPAYPERLENIKIYLRQSALTRKPSFRSKSRVFEAWKKLGYTDDPARINMPKVDNLQFEQITRFYDKYIKGKPIIVVIMGDEKAINMKQIQSKYGKVTKISTAKLFKGGF